MSEYDALLSTLALTTGVAWASGINLYALVGILGIAGAAGAIDIPDGISVVQDPLVIGAACIMYVIEFFADKIPGVDTAWDTLHSFIRVPAGALLAAGASGDVAPAWTVAAGLLGGGIAAATHAAKAGTRVVINTSPEPFSNWAASASEDALVLGGAWLMWREPGWFLILLVAFFALLIWLLPRIIGAVRGIIKRIAYWLGMGPEPAAARPSER